LFVGGGVVGGGVFVGGGVVVGGGGVFPPGCGGSGVAPLPDAPQPHSISAAIPMNAHVLTLLLNFMALGPSFSSFVTGTVQSGVLLERMESRNSDVALSQVFLSTKS
jgi:hypothetical protein